MAMGLSTETGQGDTLWGPAIGSSRGDHPWGLPTGPGHGGVGQRQPGWGTETLSLSFPIPLPPRGSQLRAQREQHDGGPGVLRLGGPQC